MDIQRYFREEMVGQDMRWVPPEILLHHNFREEEVLSLFGAVRSNHFLGSLWVVLS